MNRLERKRVQEKRRRNEFQEALENLQSCLLEHDPDFSREAQKREARSAQRQSSNFTSRSDFQSASTSASTNLTLASTIAPSCSASTNSKDWRATNKNTATIGNTGHGDTGADSYKIFNRVEILNQAVFTVNSIVQERVQLLKAIDALRLHYQLGNNYPLPEETNESCHEQVAFHEGVGPVFLRDTIDTGVVAAKDPRGRDARMLTINQGAQKAHTKVGGTGAKNTIQSQINQSSNTSTASPGITLSSSSSFHNLAPILGAARQGHSTMQPSIVPTEFAGDSSFPCSWQEHQQNILMLLASKRRELEQVQNNAFLRTHQQLLAPAYQQQVLPISASRSLLVTPAVLALSNSQYLLQQQSVHAPTVGDASSLATFVAQHRMEHLPVSLDALTSTIAGYPIDALLATQTRGASMQHQHGRDVIASSSSIVLGTNEPAHAPRPKKQTKKRRKQDEGSD